MLEINFGATSNNLNAEPIIPLTNSDINLPPACTIFGKLLTSASNNFCIISGAFSIKFGKAFINPSANPRISCIPASIITSIFSNKVVVINTIASTVVGIKFGKL